MHGRNGRPQGFEAGDNEAVWATTNSTMLYSADEMATQLRWLGVMLGCYRLDGLHHEALAATKNVQSMMTQQVERVRANLADLEQARRQQMISH